MNTAQSHVVVEFASRDCRYHEAIPIRQRPGTVLNRVQRLLKDAEAPGLHRYNLVAEVTTGSVFIMFDSGNRGDAERFATLLAMSLGWRESDGVLAGTESKGGIEV